MICGSMSCVPTLLSISLLYLRFRFAMLSLDKNKKEKTLILEVFMIYAVAKLVEPTQPNTDYTALLKLMWPFNF